jgi:hypothetical protein
METFEKCSILFKAKKGKNMALTLHFVQPPQYDLPDLRGRQAYIEYFED